MKMPGARGEENGLSVSIVVYRPDPAILVGTLASLSDAWAALRVRRPQFPVTVYLVDNGGLADISASFNVLREVGIACTTIRGHGNVGYGRGHNLAIKQARSRFHLVLNPDIDVDRHALENAMDFFDCHPDVGLLAPRVGGGGKRLQYLCRRYPALLDLFIRGFIPIVIRTWFATRLDRYEMRDAINEHDVVLDPPIISGCFMLFRTQLLKELAGFDPRYFLYFEDYDLSLRAHTLARVAYVPNVSVIHHGGGAARKGFAHIRMFLVSACKFYNRFGWKWL
ncbi:putative glycosyltransferase [Paraburkholderia ribeironis]|uniref:Putative glycosyltransferase n=1 Tax=Paraburkholderia ribeironis TaxID=1247936 RepID=A0A1N7S4N9_9BURK|nr:glycosyltransferase family 2 protein [Paraburkholderia ribeironis]SIT42331.1 putative glycosyltransferase [Paraburkholderia ribeironis]